MDSHMMLPTNPIFSPEFMMENARQYLFLAANYKNQLFNHFFKSFLSYQDLVENDSNKESNSLQKPNLNKNQSNAETTLAIIISDDENNEPKSESPNLKGIEFPKQPKIDFVAKLNTLCKRQAKVPHFERFKKIDKKKYFQNNLVWDAQKCNNAQFLKIKQEIEKLMNIRDVDEEELCKLIKENNYDYQKTLKDCGVSRMEILKKLISKKAKRGISNRKTMNSLFH